MKNLNDDVIEVFDRELDAYGEALIALEHDYDEPNILSLGDRVQELLKLRSELPRQELMERLREELGEKLLEKQKLEAVLRKEVRKKLLENRELNEQKLKKLQNEELQKKLNGRIRTGIKTADFIAKAVAVVFFLEVLLSFLTSPIGFKPPYVEGPIPAVVGITACLLIGLLRMV